MPLKTIVTYYDNSTKEFTKEEWEVFGGKIIKSGVAKSTQQVDVPD